MQEERLWIADPEAIHHILQATNYLYEKPYHTRELIVTLTDKGLGTVEGELCCILFLVCTNSQSRAQEMYTDDRGGPCHPPSVSLNLRPCTRTFPGAVIPSVPECPRWFLR